MNGKMNGEPTDPPPLFTGEVDKDWGGVYFLLLLLGVVCCISWAGHSWYQVFTFWGESDVEIVISEPVYQEVATRYPDLEQRAVTLRGKNELFSIRTIRPENLQTA